MRNEVQRIVERRDGPDDTDGNPRVLQDFREAGMKQPCNLLISTFLLLAGCTTIPFEDVPTADYSGVDEDTLLERFADRIPRKAEVLESVVFSVFGKRIVALGYVSADEEAERFVLSCMNPAGVKIFQVKSERGVSTGEFMIDVPAADKRAIGAIAEDVRRMHADWFPSPQSVLTRKKDAFIFTDALDGKRTEYIFMGPEHLLTEKRYYEGRSLAARVRLFEYHTFESHVYPSGIVMENMKYRYRLTAKVKKLHVQHPKHEIFLND